MQLNIFRSQHGIGLLGEDLLRPEHFRRFEGLWVQLHQLNFERGSAQHLLGRVPADLLEATYSTDNLEDLFDQEVRLGHCL